MNRACFVVVCCAAVVFLGGCEEEKFITDNQIKFVKAEFINSNTFKITYKAQDYHISKIQKKLFLEGKEERTYAIDKCLDYRIVEPWGGPGYERAVTFTVRPHFTPGDTIDVYSSDPEVGPTVYLSIPN